MDCFHTGLGDDTLVGKLDNDIIFKPFDKKYIFEIHFEEAAFGLDEHKFAFYIFYVFLISGQQKGMVSHCLFNCFLKSFGNDRFDQIVDGIHFVTVDGIFGIGRCKYDQSTFRDGTGKFQSGNLRHADIQKDQVDWVLMDKFGC